MGGFGSGVKANNAERALRGLPPKESVRPVAKADVPLLKSPEMPDILLVNKFSQEEWHRILPILMESQILTSGNLMMFTVMCSIAGAIAQKFADGKLPSDNILTQYRVYANTFGLAPICHQKAKASGETNLRAEREEDSNKFGKVKKHPHIAS